MDISDLFTSCRKGDVGRVRYLLEQRDVDVNVWDKWDSTPLYYACLCGHEELVLYLLANGARCEANTFHGERCFYGAASDTIRRALLDYKQVTPSSRRRDYYDEFLQRLLDQGIHSDVLFVVHGKPFRAHRCILGARSSYFANMLDTKWKGKSIVVLRHPLINAVAFGALLQYLYTGGLDVGVEHISDCERLAKQCQLLDLLNDLEAKCKEVSEFVASKPGTHVKVLSMRPPAEDPRLREDLALLADCALPPELRGDLGELPFPFPDGFNSCPDVCFQVEGCSFLCHKVPPEVAYDVLSMADMYLLPGLKRLCGRSLAQLLDEDSVVGLWRVAKLFRLARLEDQCTEYMAKVIEKLVEQEDFSEAVREEAAAVRGRQEQDSIPLVDDIRFHITSVVQTYSNIKEMERRLHALEDLLVSIGLDC
uniref:Ankyrin repeat and BTB domain containing 1 n=1 Tax=Myotis myotis TaxID=51298 RepID=A0A7J7VWG6_MYOMY|nr:ankyrin repeat and BTB domain containing 1 [Myotis myotis]